MSKHGDTGGTSRLFKKIDGGKVQTQTVVDNIFAMLIGCGPRAQGYHIF
jgi:hypothetical protein